MSVETSTSRFDALKWVVVFILVAVAVVGNSYFADQSLLYRVLGILAVAAVAALVALQTAKGAAFWALVKGSRTEIRKVVWPTRQETVQTTMIVVVFVLLVALILWGLDSLLGWLVSLAIT
ncbi:MAG: preprotein translocase subunit SecE [Pseudomonadales bacterium]|nr:preprotein translocase subunit SecE [Pseudomonadales bacterium]MCP5204101.1 preprotein translocase subunit SecE [Pseudomonadales bacterium]